MASEQSSHFDVPVDVGLFLSCHYFSAHTLSAISESLTNEQKRTYPGVHPAQSFNQKQVFGGYQLRVAATQFASQCQATNHRPAVTISNVRSLQLRRQLATNRTARDAEASTG